MTSLDKNLRLRQLIAGSTLGVAMSTHSPLSALLAEHAGFDALWGSGFELSASYAVPDANILSWGVHLDLMRSIAARTSIPLIADIDTGFGNAVNVAFVIRQYETAGVSAVVIEDKTYPKDTSLRPGGRQQLVGIDEFRGKIEAAISSRKDPNFSMIARTEALIADLGQDEALVRASAYADAGADAVLIHSKQSTSKEIESFIERWSGAVPLVIVPTAYPQLTEEAVIALGKVGLVIYGNHAIRAAIGAMQETFTRIRHDRGIHGIDTFLPTVKDVLALQGEDAMRAVERQFLR